MRTYKLILLLLLSTGAFCQDSLLTVEDAIKLALKNNYNIEIAKNDIEINRINNNWATAGAYPKLSATAGQSFGSNNINQKLSNGTTTVQNSAPVSSTNAGFNLNWVLFNGYRVRAVKKRLEELEQQGEISLKARINESVYDVVAAWYNMIRLNQLIKATEEQIRLSSERKYIADARFRIGTGAKNDVLQSQVDLNEQMAIKINLQNNRQLAMNQLSTLMKTPSSKVFYIRDTIELKPLPDSSLLREKILNQNPSILLAKNNLALLMQSRREINAQRLPVVTFNGNYNFVRNKNGAGFTLLNQTYGPSASIGLAVPIFNGGTVKKQLQVADINYKNQELINKQLEDDLLLSMTNAYTNYANALAVLELEKANFEFLKENIFIATERFKKLVITSIELRQVQFSYIDAQTRFYDALYRAKLAEAELDLLSGEMVN